MRLTPRSVRGRLTLWYSLALGLMLVAFAAGAFTVLRRVLASRSDDFLAEARDAFASELTAEAGETALLSDAVRAAQRDVHFREIDFLVYDPRQHDWVGAPAEARPTTTRNGETPPAYDRQELARQIDAQFQREQRAPSALVTLVGEEGGYRAALRSLNLTGAPYGIAAVRSRLAQLETMEAVGLAFSISVPVFLLIACLGGYLLARRALSPISAMSRRARLITATRLHERLPVGNPHDELGELCTIVNDLLSRLQGAFEQQRRFVADASHELRTPVSIICVESDLALQQSRSGVEYRDVLRVVQDASNRLSRIVNDLFLLARADAGRQPVRQEAIYLDEVILDATRGMRALAELRDIRIEVGRLADAPTSADPELIGRLLLNLLDNAIKYSAAGSTIEVQLRQRPGWYDVHVIDAGPGVPPDAQPFIFDRFYRVDKARSRNESSLTSGAGLGLALARWIAEAHGGRLELVRSTAAGSEFRFSLPIKTPEEVETSAAVS